MKIWFLTLIALFAFGLTACRDKTSDIKDLRDSKGISEFY
jgi:hypothetical protein